MRVDPKKPFHLVQVLRGVAAVMVVANHFTVFASDRGWMPKWAQGQAGVDIFFVVSGFVMAHSYRSLAGSAAPAWSFLKRRLERIFPLYWILTTLKLALMFVVPEAAGRGLPDARRIVLSYLLLPTWNADGAMVPVLSWGWTLQFEMLFYLLFALAIALRWRPLTVVAPVLGVLACGRLVFHWKHLWLLDFYNPIVLEFLFGMVLFRVYERGWRWRPWMGWLLLATGTGGLLLTPDGWRGLTRGLEWGPLATALVAAAVLLEDRWGGRGPRWMLRLGDGSYSLYLLHFFVCAAVVAAIGRLPLTPRVLLGLAATVSLAASLISGELLFRWVDLPMIQFFRGRRRAAVESGT